MNRLMKYYMMGLLTMMTAACNDEDGYSIGDIAVDWVTVHVEGDGVYSFVGDTWGTMFPAATSYWGYMPVEGERAFLRFNPLYDNYGGYDVGIKVEDIQPVLTKTVEAVNEDNESQFADHPTYLRNLWIGGGYLNVQFLQKCPANGPHRVSLVHQEGQPLLDEEGYAHLEYRYNSYGDTLNVPLKGMVCFNLNTILAENPKGIVLRVNDAEDGKQFIRFNFDEVNKEKVLPSESIENESSIK